MDNGGYAFAGAWDDWSADGLAEPGDDAADDAGSDNVEFADVVDFQCWFAEASLYGWREAVPGGVAEEPLYAVWAGRPVGFAVRSSVCPH
jgi:hypothetical protein